MVFQDNDLLPISLRIWGRIPKSITIEIMRMLMGKEE